MLKNKFIKITDAPKLFDTIYCIYHDKSQYIVYDFKITGCHYNKGVPNISYMLEKENISVGIQLFFNENEDLTYIYSNTETYNVEDFYLDKNEAYLECSKRIQNDIDEYLNEIKRLQTQQVKFKKEYEKSK
jgi:hypothetical protein